MDPFYNLCFVFVFVIPCISVVTCRERDELLALLCVMCFFVPLLHSHMVLYLIVSIPDLCLLPYFVVW